MKLLSNTRIFRLQYLYAPCTSRFESARVLFSSQLVLRQELSAFKNIKRVALV
jgi:hypothetical protein